MSPLQATQQLILKQISSVRIPKQVYAIFIFIYFGQSVIAQPVTSSTVNVTGGSATSGNYRFEWSVGEASAITTMGNSNLIVTCTRWHR
jgi:hypothetical protein